VLLPPVGYPIAVNKYIDINRATALQRHGIAGRKGDKT